MKNIYSDVAEIIPRVPRRITPRWPDARPVPAYRREHLTDIAQGRLPLGLLPQRALGLTEAERLGLLDALRRTPATKYKSTGEDQSVSCWGQPFVDADSVTGHLSRISSPEIRALSAPLLLRLKVYLQFLGFEVEDMLDPVTCLAYPAGVFREINVVNEASVLHTDDFTRDGLKKPDFRWPDALTGRDYHQVSFNLLLDDGGFEPDALYVYNRMNTPADEQHCMSNGWQFPASLLENCASVRYVPKVGEAYVFCTNNYHDVRGGSDRAKRMTFSVFGIFVPELNRVMLYN